MGDQRSPSGKRPTTKWWWAASLVLVAAGVGGGWWATHRPSAGPTIPKPWGQTSIAPPVLTTSTLSTTTTVASTQAMTGPTPTARLVSITTPVPAAAAESPRTKVVTVKWVSRSIPVHITIPSIGVSAKLVQLGLTAGRQVQVPSSWYIPGWYKFGPAPGQEGSAVILGHVDSKSGPAVFYKLDQLKYGQQVIVKSANGRVLHFAVIGMREYQKSKFPDQVVYGPRHYAALQLVTCGGIFDRATGHYLSNIVVFTALVKS